MMHVLKKYSVPVLCVLLGISIGVFYGISHAKTITIRGEQVREYKEPQGLTNPLLYTDDVEPSPDLNDLKNSVKNEITKIVKAGNAESVSLYFRDLNSGRWTGINENETYKPSSMLKVMVMMTYYKQASTDPKILEEKLYYEPKSDPGQHYKPEHVLSAGYYTVQELIDQMITYSDNDAAAILTEHNTKNYIDLFSIMRLPYPKDNAVIDFMSPQSYAILFRTLYSGTYLSHRRSENALQLLTQTTFHKGIEAGVPGNVTVAHKFGEFTEMKPDLTIISHELHDCGIIYKEQNPYLLCIMTKGKDFASLESVITTLSKNVYEKR
jgi:beta-lactamase class A